MVGLVPTVACAPSGPSAAQPAATGQPLKTPSQPYLLPADPSAVILRWDSRGGMRPEPEQPALLLHASGDFSARPLPGSTVRRQGRLDAAAVQALLNEILVQHRFASISAADIQSQISEISQRTGRLFAVMDGGETRIELQLPAVQHHVVLPAMQAARARFPEIEPLQRLHAIQQRLLALAETAK